MKDEDEQQEPIDGPTAFLLKLVGNMADAKKKFDETIDKVSAPTIDVRFPLVLVTRMIDNVVCECDMCLGTLVWAKSIDTSKLDEQLRRLIELSIANAELRLLSNKLVTEYKRTYGHNPQ